MDTLIAKFGVIARPFANFIYSLYKHGPTRDRIVFLTRQSDSLTLDFKLIIEELKRRSPDTEIICVCKKLGPGIWGALQYLLVFFRQMSALGTARVAVIDGYIPVVSYLDQRDELYVLQMWHAFGAFKKFSYCAVNTEGGRCGEVAQAFRMHSNYSAVLCGGEVSRPAFSQAFNLSPDKILVMPLPRYDELIKVAQASNDNDGVSGHATDETVVLYAPTFRDTDTEINFAGIRKLARACKGQGFKLVLKLHPLVEDSLSVEEAAKMGCTLVRPCSLGELMSGISHVVTDYSAIAFEAAVAEKPVWFYVFDSDEYADLRGLLFNPEEILPSRCFGDAEGLAAWMKADSSVTPEQQQFRERFITAPQTTATSDIVKVILKQISKDRS